jgi:hypothetical protein
MKSNLAFLYLLHLELFSKQQEIENFSIKSLEAFLKMFMSTNRISASLAKGNKWGHMLPDPMSKEPGRLF